MMSSSIPTRAFLIRFLVINILGLFFTHIALGQENSANQLANKVTGFVSDLIDSNNLPDKFISDGSEIDVNRLGIKISPPEGWEVLTSSPNVSLIMQEPESDKIVYDEAIFRRNITVAAVHKPAPIDEKRAATLKQELLDSFGKEGVQNFEVIEHKFFNYKSKDDGLIAYTSFNIGEFSMMQMHVLLSGDSKQFLLTYTDLADRFSESKHFDNAWNTMATMTVSGQPPRRYLRETIMIAIAGALVLLLVLFRTLRRRKETSSYIDEADSIYQEDHSEDDLSFKGTSLPTTQTGVWQLTSSTARPLTDY